MADVRTHDRAQLFLIGALAVAVLFVSLALLLNTAIYTENLATRNTETDVVEAHEFRESTGAGVAGVVGYANYRENESYGTLQTSVEAGVNDIDNGSTIHGAVRGRPVRVSLVSIDEGTRITHDQEGPFVNELGAGDWKVVDDTPASRDVRLDVSTTNLASGSGLSSVPDYRQSSLFHFDVEEVGGPTYEVFVYATNSSQDVSVRVVEDDGTPEFVGSECSQFAGTEKVLVSVSRSTVGGSPCPALAFTDEVGEHDIWMQNATYMGTTNIEGTYELFVDRDVAVVESTSGPYYVESLSTQSPYATPAVYTANVSLDYETTALAYDTEIEVDPSEHPRRYGIGRQSWRLSLAGGGGGGGGGGEGDDGNAPSGTVNFDGTVDRGGNRYDVDVDWTASDDTTVSSVEIVLRDPDGGVQRTRTINPGSPAASGDVTFPNVKITGKYDGSTWTVEITVYDNEGLSGTASGSEVLP